VARSQRSKLFLIKSKQYQFVRQLSGDAADIAGCSRGVGHGASRTELGCIVLGGAIKRVAKQNYQVASPSATLTWSVHLYIPAQTLSRFPRFLIFPDFPTIINCHVEPNGIILKFTLLVFSVSLLCNSYIFYCKLYRACF